MDTVSTTLQEMLAGLLSLLPDLIIALLIFIVSLWSVIVLGIVAALQQVGFNLTAFLTGLGILGFTVGFALQDVSKNFIAGLLLLLEQPFDIGDTIEVGKHLGTVANVEIRATEIYTVDGQNVIIPNAEVFTSPIKNYSRYTKRRFDLSVGVAYDSDLELVRETALGVINTIPGVLSEPAPRVVFNNLGASTIDFTVYYWVDLKIGDYFGSIDRSITGIKTAFEEMKIEMPYPIQTVLLNK